MSHVFRRLLIDFARLTVDDHSIFGGRILGSDQLVAKIATDEFGITGKGIAPPTTASQRVPQHVTAVDRRHPHWRQHALVGTWVEEVPRGSSSFPTLQTVWGKS